jgi:hypothetical protein
MINVQPNVRNNHAIVAVKIACQTKQFSMTRPSSFAPSARG